MLVGQLLVFDECEIKFETILIMCREPKTYIKRTKERYKREVQTPKLKQQIFSKNKRKIQT